MKREIECTEDLNTLDSKGIAIQEMNFQTAEKLIIQLMQAEELSTENESKDETQKKYQKDETICETQQFDS